MLKKTIKKAARITGLDIQRINSTKYEDPAAEPLEVLYKSNGGPLMMNVPLAKCIYFSLSSYPIGIEGKSPFVETLRSYMEGRCSAYEGSPMEQFYKSFQPVSAAEFMGITDPVNPRLKSLPPGGGLQIWSDLSPDEMLAKRNKTEERDNTENNGKNISHEAGNKFWGPVSKDKGRLEFERLISVYESIKDNGYREDCPGGPRGTCLVSAGITHRVFIAGGQHRMAALAALGYTHAPIQIEQENGIGGVVARESVSHWPPVRNGFISANEALLIFDRMCRGEQPDVNQARCE